MVSAMSGHAATDYWNGQSFIVGVKRVKHIGPRLRPFQLMKNILCNYWKTRVLTLTYWVPDPTAGLGQPTAPAVFIKTY